MQSSVYNTRAKKAMKRFSREETAVLIAKQEPKISVANLSYLDNNFLDEDFDLPATGAETPTQPKQKCSMIQDGKQAKEVG